MISPWLECRPRRLASASLSRSVGKTVASGVGASLTSSSSRPLPSQSGKARRPTRVGSSPRPQPADRGGQDLTVDGREQLVAGRPRCAPVQHQCRLTQSCAACNPAPGSRQKCASGNDVAAIASGLRSPSPSPPSDMRECRSCTGRSQGRCQEKGRRCAGMPVVVAGRLRRISTGSGGARESLAIFTAASATCPGRRRALVALHPITDPSERGDRSPRITGQTIAHSAGPAGRSHLLAPSGVQLLLGEQLVVGADSTTAPRSARG